MIEFILDSITDSCCHLNDDKSQAIYYLTQTFMTGLSNYYLLDNIADRLGIFYV